MVDENILQEVYLFQDLKPDQLTQVGAIATVKTFAGGDDIFSKGEPARALYVIKKGSVRIHHSNGGDHFVEVAILGVGSHFGEMAFVDSETRSASASAIESSEIIIFAYEALRKLLETNQSIAISFYKCLSHFLCGRLRLTTNDLSFSRENNLRHF